MASHNVRFTWTQITDPATQRVQADVFDANGVNIGSSGLNPVGTATTVDVTVPAGTNYTGRLTAFNSIGLPCPQPPQGTINVADVAVPANPQLVSITQVS